jgi:hypothetical protein
MVDNAFIRAVDANGKEIRDSVNEVVLWFCYNCVQDTLRDRGK